MVIQKDMIAEHYRQLEAAPETGDPVIYTTRPLCDVLLFGALVDGSTDDTTAYNRAITQASAFGGVQLCLLKQRSPVTAMPRCEPGVDHGIIRVVVDRQFLARRQRPRADRPAGLAGLHPH